MANIFSDKDFFNINLNTNFFDNIGGKPITGYIPPAPPVPIHNICFIAKTPIKTDQGIFHIDKIIPKHHTIQNKKICAITQTISKDKYLVCFEKNSLGLNHPCERTIMSKDHKIYYKKQMIESYKFIEQFKNVNKIKYTGEILYNIVMENYDIINVNKLICETLHPNNIIAKLYTSNLDQEYKNKIIIVMNDCIIKNNYQSYKKIIKNLH